MSQDSELQELIDRQKIYNTLVRYCRGYDRCDVEMINASYHKDAKVAYATFTAVGDQIGPAIMELITKRSHLKTNSHNVLNHYVELHGDIAKAETYFIMCGLTREENPESLEERGGRYLDKFVKQDGEWKIMDRVVIWDWARTSELPKPFSPPEGAAAGTRTKDDPSYAFFRDL